MDYEKNDEIKDAYPKMVCHMPKRHVKKKKKKMHTQRRYATCPQGMSKEKKGGDSPHPRKIKKRDGSCKGVHPPYAKKKNPHTCTS